MTKFMPLIAACLIGSTATAQDLTNIQNHAIQQMYWKSPCAETVGLIDYDPDASTTSMQEMVTNMSRQAMAWGHLLGFESANPGIRGDHETILMRLRDDCAAQPDKTAMELLQGYANG